MAGPAAAANRSAHDASRHLTQTTRHTSDGRSARSWEDCVVANSPFLTDGKGSTGFADLIEHAEAAASRLHDTRHVVNLCEQRKGFLAGFFGALAMGVTTLLPASRARGAVQGALATYRDCGLLENADDRLPISRDWSAPGIDAAFAGERPAVIGFTSGSTGPPSAHAKFWSSIRATSGLNARAIDAVISNSTGRRTPWIVGTVPPHHMYGMELTALLPMLFDFGLHAGRPLFPADVASALRDVPDPRVLVSTPAHLRALVMARVDLPSIAVVISATAPMDQSLAKAVEDASGAPLLEMFGATETCILGHRQTSSEPHWTPYEGVRFSRLPDGTLVDAPWFREPQRLADDIRMTKEGRFELLGRSSDVIEVAGKRASLARITNAILSIDGVRDAVVFQPSTSDRLVRRLVAFVVADDVLPETVRAHLERSVDPVFLPRPITFVESLPRTETGKLTAASLDDLLSLHETARHTGD